MPVDQYVGGIEHAVLHLLYARFFTKVLRDLDLIGVDEPFSNLLTQGMVCKETLRCDVHGWLYPEEVSQGVCKQCKQPITIGRIEKMSKTTKNIVDPQTLIDQYGADTARLFCLFASPPEKDLDWNEQGVEGAFRFLNRVWRMTVDHLDLLTPVAPFSGTAVPDGDLRKLRLKTHATIRKVSNDIEDRFHFNTAISAVMELVNAIYQFDIASMRDETALAVIKEAIEAVVLLLAPMVPHMAEELWERLGNRESIFNTPWPAYDPAAIAEDEMTIVVQVNGKLRSTLVVPVDATQEAIKTGVLADEKLKKWIEGAEIKKVIVVPKKLVNIVVK
jgi:leucyl-tRNA synthetase